MKRLYTAETKGMRMYFVEDWETDLAICVDWDLDKDEEKELISAFENGTLIETANGGAWEPIDAAYADTYNKSIIA